MITIISNDQLHPRAEEILNLATKHGLKLSPESIEMNESGMDFLVAFASADPGKDFVIYYALFGMEGLRDLLQRYERFGGKVWPRMPEHIAEQWAAYPVLVAKFALTSGEEANMEMARNMITHWDVD